MKRNRDRIVSNEKAAEIQPPMPGMNIAMCAKEERRPSPQERRAKLIAAHVALEDVGRHMNFPDWQALETVKKSILASIGEMEVRGQ
jgi:hypothetical protein